jgi:hypothetical protein
MRENNQDADVTGALIRLADVPGLEWMPRRRPRRDGEQVGHSNQDGKPVVPVGLATVHRWAADGIKGRKLRTIRAGGALVTTREWILEFFEALSDPNATVASTRTPRQRQTAKARAAAELERAGI